MREIFESIYYSELLWFGAAFLFIFLNRGHGWFYIIITLFIIWLLGHAAIISLGIEVFFILLAIVIVLVHLKNRR